MDLWLWVQLLCLLSLPVAVLLYRSELIPFTLLAGFIAAALLVCSLLGLVFLFKLVVGFVQQQSSPMFYWLGLVVGLAIALLLIVFLQQAKSYPLIHNISTDLASPPEFSNAPALRGVAANPLEYTADIARQQKAAYPQLNTLRVALSFDEAFAKAQTIASDQGWSIEYVNKQQGMIEATERSRVFGFVDDIVLRVKQAEEGGVIIDLRSVSRVGRSDFGVNAKRIRQFLAAF